MAGDFVSKSLLVSLDALTHCCVSSTGLNVCSGLDGTCYRCNTLVDLGLTFLDDSKIKHTIYITFDVNPFAQLEMIIGRKSLNQHYGSGWARRGGCLEAVVSYSWES